MKWNNACLFCCMILFLTLSACGREAGETVPVTIAETTESYIEETQPKDFEQESIAERCAEILAACPDTPMDAEEMENLLMEKGFAVMDTSQDCPAYLTTPDRLRDFWEKVQSREEAEQEILRVNGEGGLSYTLFRYTGDACFVYFMNCGLDGDGAMEVSFYEKHTVQDMALTDRGNFYYRIHAAEDKHYADYTRIRLTPPDPELYAMTRKYILPVGYVGVNLFLCDWTETDFGALSFNDLWEFFYYASCGKQYSPAANTYHPEGYCYEIPAAEFERLVMPYFRITPEEFRELAFYDSEGDCYPWRPLATNDFVHLWYYTCEPEVTAYQSNPDGTVTLTVEVLSTDLKLDCLFAHEVTVRPLENGNFQYVGNRLTFQTEYGLPDSEARLFWDVL